MNRQHQDSETPRPPGTSQPRGESDIPPAVVEQPLEHEGATEEQVGDRTGPAAGYDAEPEQVKDRGGVG